MSSEFSIFFMKVQHLLYDRSKRLVKSLLWGFVSHNIVLVVVKYHPLHFSITEVVGESAHDECTETIQLLGWMQFRV